ncbi:uncharacterized protein MYCFIDRAFT_174307 [Pseudocercospora fijiensis CIRAD86]|uniref:Uncharacterized protein n=1 Tax=Pseudocercospora fijiensis (strain CIRAD86) TaxID=383855 RepID=M3B025_PSEFD|nr:uncharacterized protein MYCFIDRAFT_174307 [Pseudocercospora fijiensis CIRAD86]EME82762.1 hypothetical protein MYCFIDRAFT_174307 [Pseudocercospora fijiensis CIRAD86]
MTVAGPAQEEVGHPLEACAMAALGIDPLDTQPLANAVLLTQVIPASSFDFPRFKQLRFEEQESVAYNHSLTQKWDSAESAKVYDLLRSCTEVVAKVCIQPYTLIKRDGRRGKSPVNFLKLHSVFRDHPLPPARLIRVYNSVLTPQARVVVVRSMIRPRGYKTRVAPQDCVTFVWVELTPMFTSVIRTATMSRRGVATSNVCRFPTQWKHRLDSQGHPGLCANILLACRIVIKISPRAGQIGRTDQEHNNNARTDGMGDQIILSSVRSPSIICFSHWIKQQSQGSEAIPQGVEDTIETLREGLDGWNSQHRNSLISHCAELYYQQSAEWKTVRGHSCIGKPSNLRGL